MHIDNVTVNITSPAEEVAALLSKLLATTGSAAAQPITAALETTLAPPAIGQAWPGQGGIYAGLARGEDGRPDHHLILAAALPDKELAWSAAVDWAKGVESEGHTDFSLPTRFESALLYANLRAEIGTAWHWTGTQSSESHAWGQYFHYGTQYYDLKSVEGRARAVRRLTA